jgi:uncharacterized RmlC-like cupin family protein
VARTASTRKTARKTKTAAKRPTNAKRPASAKRPTNAKRLANAKRPAKKVAAKSAARRTRPATKPRAAARKAPQRFTVSHHREEDFKPDGLRAYALYRDLGIAAATAGLCQAQVIRLLGPCTDDVRKRHFHETELQLVYVLKGWMKNEFEGHGEELMQAGSCWLQPPGIEHTVLDYSDDCEVLEIIVPADFKTVELAK